jgi:CheY-like chemotaxis protein
MPGRAPDVGRVAPEAGYSVVTISDTGTGIAAEHLPKLFERYFSTKGNAGTGLGMPIVATILRENDAALWVDSKAGAGTSVTVAWPSAGPEPLAGAITRRAGPDTAPGLPSGLRILIVDDVPDVAEVLASIVSMAGGNVVSTSDPASALGMIADPTASWSVLVTDLDMPGQTGADLARAAARRDPPLPVLLVTALPERATRDSHLFAGVLSKPVDAGRLIRLVRAVVSG